jgi:hypothetical protein
VLLALFAAALAAPSIASAATPQGKLTGSATFVISPVAVVNPVVDGGTDPLYIGKENDKSGNCNGDSGTFTDLGGTHDVLCVHFVASSGCCNAGSPKMRFAYQNPSGSYEVIRITDNGASTDTVAFGNVNSLATAVSWVNKGAIGSGQGFSAWQFVDITRGDFTVTP